MTLNFRHREAMRRSNTPWDSMLPPRVDSLQLKRKSAATMAFHVSTYAYLADGSVLTTALQVPYSYTAIAPQLLRSYFPTTLQLHTSHFTLAIRCTRPVPSPVMDRLWHT